jgi:hypothetical protein
MFRRVVTIAAIAFVCAAPSAMAQRAQVTVFGGYTLSDGVTGDAFKAGDGNTYNGIDLKDSMNWGFGVGFYASDNIEIGFRFGQQLSKLTLTGTATHELGDMKVNTYHPYIAFNAGARDAKTRPYFMVGFGATNYPAINYTKVNGQTGTTGGNTQFSTTLGAGVNIFPSPNAGLHLGLQWTPTYIKSDAAGWWCDPYWGCYLATNAQYSNQFAFNGGVTFRF